jgi:hypothetical protein
LNSQIKSTEGNGKARSARGLLLIATVAAIGLLALVFLLNVLLPGPSGAQHFYRRGIEYYNAHKYSDAKHWFSSAIEVNLKFEEAYFARAIVHKSVQRNSNRPSDDIFHE